MKHRWCFRRGWLGRKPTPRTIDGSIKNVHFIPLDSTGNRIWREPITLYPDEVEALRLVYLENRTQEEASKAMNISRGTLWRLLDSGRKKLIQAIVEVRPVTVVGIGGDEDPCIDVVES
ncbi:MAG: DUF134 domain-containing protein [Ignisphaera sp.]